ncbi:aldolase [Guyanagaster necrorhizus]|uniref:Aldolase n=1 Tax=Guyanagaster necrorhizus TaxID=856835 RepID=A0A9P7VJJ5_9AGAR|nr:aldolase [Guyanagaster necrorhizus MCA 3950]KAG7442303.1 aldolase [Guyanagaster necrorhizus MCA 3950]
MAHPPPPGCHVATILFMTENEDLDPEAIESHTLRLALGGVAGILVHGDNGEAQLLSKSERRDVIKITRQVLDKNGFTNVPVIAGASAPSTRMTIQLCKEAADSGASYALITPESAIASYRAIADNFPIPIIIYNFPTVTNGLNLDSDAIVDLAEHPNIVGAKLACGEMGKLHRLASVFSPSEFGIYTSTTDCMLHGLISGCAGTMSASPNIIPKLHVALYDLFKLGKMDEGLKLQTNIAHADWVVRKLAPLAGIFGCGSNVVRSPLKAVGADTFMGSNHSAALEEVIGMEKQV